MIIDLQAEIDGIDWRPEPVTSLDAHVSPDRTCDATQTEDFMLEDHTIDFWKHEKHNPHDISRLKVIFGGSNLDHRTPLMPFTSDIFLKTMDYLEIPRHFAAAVGKGNLQQNFTTFEHIENDDNGQLFVFVARTSKWTALHAISMSWRPETGVTNVFVQGSSDIPSSKTALKKLQDAANLTSHPALPLLLFLQAQFHTLELYLIDTYDNDIVDLEVQIGQVPYMVDRDVPLEELDSFGLTKRLNKAQNQVTLIATRLKSLTLFLEHIKIICTKVGEIHESLSGTSALADRRRLQFQKDAHLMSQHIQFLEGQLTASNLYITHMESRCRSQLTLVYNYAALQENRINRKIADESARLARESKNIAAASTRVAEAARKDSSAMLGIALLTMLFLPATFVSTLLSLPVFNWNADPLKGESMVSGKFRVYWIITIPLTAFVMLIYGLWMFKSWFQRPDKKSKIQKEKEYDQEPDGDNASEKDHVDEEAPLSDGH